MSQDGVGEQVLAQSRASGTVAALIIAPIVGGLATSFAFAVSVGGWQMLTAKSGQADLANFAMTSAFVVAYAIATGVIFAFPIAFIVGWSIHRLLTHYRKVGPASYVSTMTAVSTIGYAILCLASGVDLMDGYRPIMLAAVAFWGGAGGFVFWLIRRPDRNTVASRS